MFDPTFVTFLPSSTFLPLFSSYYPPNDVCMDKRLFTSILAPDERAKHAYYCQRHQDEVCQNLIRCSDAKYCGFINVSRASVFFEIKIPVSSQWIMTLSLQYISRICSSMTIYFSETTLQQNLQIGKHGFQRILKKPQYFNFLRKHKIFAFWFQVRYILFFYGRCKI